MRANGFTGGQALPRRPRLRQHTGLWFETRREAALLTMRVWDFTAKQDLIL